MAERGVVRVEVHIEGVLVVQWMVFPAQLNVGHLQGIADGLDGVGAGALGRPEDCHHAQCQLVTGCNRGRVTLVSAGGLQTGEECLSLKLLGKTAGRTDSPTHKPSSGKGVSTAWTSRVWIRFWRQDWSPVAGPRCTHDTEMTITFDIISSIQALGQILSWGELDKEKGNIYWLVPLQPCSGKPDLYVLLITQHGPWGIKVAFQTQDIQTSLPVSFQTPMIQ